MFKTVKELKARLDKESVAMYLSVLMLWAKQNLQEWIRPPGDEMEV